MFLSWSQQSNSGDRVKREAAIRERARAGSGFVKSQREEEGGKRKE
jgi:hypothetical protein